MQTIISLNVICEYNHLITNIVKDDDVFFLILFIAIVFIVLLFSYKENQSSENEIIMNVLVTKRLNEMSFKMVTLNNHIPYKVRREATSYSRELEYEINKSIKLRILTQADLSEIEEKVNKLYSELTYILGAKLNDDDKNELLTKLSLKVMDFFEMRIEGLSNNIKKIDNSNEKDAILKRIEKL